MDLLRERLSKMLAFGDKPISLAPPLPERIEAVLERHGPFVPFLEMQAEADALIFELIAERRAEQGERDDILSMLIDARHEDGSPMSEQELRDELMTMLVAGHETTASTLAWTFERLVREPRVLERLREEIRGPDGDAYVTATVQEALRRRPVLPNVAPRLVKQPIEVGGWSYPAGVCLVPNAYLLHHDPDVYEDPYAFRPERFLEQPPGTYTWIPFGGGRRRCIGASFAMLETTIVLRAILEQQSVEAVSPRPEPTRRRNITIRPGAGSRVRLTTAERHRAGSASIAA
jgi:cytochrome P450